MACLPPGPFNGSWYVRPSQVKRPSRMRFGKGNRIGTPGRGAGVRGLCLQKTRPPHPNPSPPYSGERGFGVRLSMVVIVSSVFVVVVPGFAGRVSLAAVVVAFQVGDQTHQHDAEQEG